MKILESISSAVNSVFSNKGRAFLTMLGIIIGISSVILITSIGQGFQALINGQFADLGLDQATLYMEGTDIKDTDYLRMDDVAFIRQIPGIRAATSRNSVGLTDAVTLLNPEETRSINLNGVDPDYFAMDKKKFTYGRELAQQDIAIKNQVAVIDADFAKAVFGHENAVGQTLSVKTWYGAENFTVVGVYAADAQMLMGAMFSRPADVYIPSSVLMDMTGGEDICSSVMFAVTDQNTAQQTSDMVIRVLEVKHQTTGIYKTWLISSFIDQVNTVLSVFTLFLGFVAAISLLVGGIGVMNIMLVTVTERTREIGVRKALGATNGNVCFQFLVESGVLTIIGGILGILVGYTLALLLGSAISMGMQLDTSLVPSFSANTIILAVGVSSLVGIVFGVYPAFRAAKMNAIDALRYE